MKKIFALLTIMMLAAPLFSQDDIIDGFSFDSEPLKSESTPYFAIGAGYTYSFLFMNYDEVNKMVKSLGLSEMSGPIYLSGIHGFTGLVVVPNLRLGFFGVSGSKISEKDFTEQNITTKRTAELYVGMNGFSLDYGFVPFKSFAVLPGVNFGWGTYRLQSYEAPSSIDWKSESNINDVANTNMSSIENSLMFVEPQINIEYAVTNFSMVRLQVGYNYTFDSPLADKKWKYNNNAELKNVPSGLNSNGLKATIGIYLGLFNY